MMLVPLFDLKFLNELAAPVSRNFKSAAPAGFSPTRAGQRTSKTWNLAFRGPAAAA